MEKFSEKPMFPGIQMSLLDVPDPPRYWFATEAGSQLIQVQQDRFVHNWRKTTDAEPYPRYESIRKPFAENLEVFCGFLSENRIGDFVPNQVELTYVNIIPSGEGWERFCEIEKVVTVSRLEYSDNFLSEPENINYYERHLIHDEGQPIGRLHINIKPTIRISDNKQMLEMNLVARGIPIGSDIEGVLKFLDLGREWIVRGFASITRPEMHKQWGRTK